MKLEAKQITKQFGCQTALDHVDLTIENGEFFGLLGTNGAGKTTMIRILSTLMLPTSGTVLADGQELTRSRVELKKKITVMTQEYTLRNDMSIEEILEYQGRLYHVPKAKRRARAEELMELTGLTQQLPHLMAENGVKTHRGFIQQDDLRLGQHGSAEHDLALHAAGQMADQLVPVVIQAGELHQFAGPFSALLFGNMVEPALIFENFFYGHVISQGVFLSHDGNFLFQFHIAAGQFRAVCQNLT